MATGNHSQLFQSFWYGPQLSLYEQLSIRSFLAHGHSYHLYTYGNVAGVPTGCTIMDAAEILPESLVFSYKERPSYAAFADWFRCQLLALRGGWWVDTDIVCLSDEWPDEPRQIGFQAEGSINNAVIRAEPGDRLMQEAFTIARGMGQDIGWGEGGPRLLTRLIATGDYGYKLHNRGLFYPIGYESFNLLLFPALTTPEKLRAQGAVCIHLWNEMFRDYKLDKSAAPPPLSLLETLFKLHGMLDGFTQQYLYNAAEWKLEGPLPRARITPRLVEMMLEIALDASQKMGTTNNG